MSSWANRNLPRRRDLSQVPEEFRPVVVPRAFQPLILESETYQPKPEPLFDSAVSLPAAGGAPRNEIIYPSRGGPVSSSASSTLQGAPVYLPSIQPPSPSAKELTLTDGSTVVFVILRNLRQQRDNELWIQSYNSIRKFYTNPIKIIDDNSSINTVNGRLVNTEIIYSDFNGAGEILPYYYFVLKKWADRMIFLHDSMFLNRPFRSAELEGRVKMHWYFEGNGFDNDTKVQTYLSVLKNRDGLAAYLSVPHHEWRGCFGGASMIDLEVAEQLEAKYNLFSKPIIMIRTRADREAFERFFGKVLFFEGLVTAATCSMNGDILRYPNAFEPMMDLSVDKVAALVSQRGYDTPILKVWRGR